MGILRHTIKWDFILLLKYGIITVAASISAIYCISLLLAKANNIELIVVLLVFSDPVMYGFLFSAIIILFEKDSMTNQALAITPLTSRDYLFSKSVAFTFLAIVCSIAIIISSKPEIFHPVIFLLAVTLSSVLFVLIGIVSVSYTKSFTQFILVIPIVFLPTCLPFLSYFNLINSWIFYLIPTQASLILFKGSISTISIWEIAYAVTYLLMCIYFVNKWAEHSYKKRILKTDRDE